MDELQTTGALTRMTRLSQRRPDQTKRLSAVLARNLPRLAGIAVEVAQATGDPMGKVLADLLSSRPEECQALAALAARVPQRTVTLREAGYLLAYARLEAAGGAADRAAALSDLAFRLNRLGRREQSAAASREAVELYRELIRTDRSVHRGDLAAALVNLGNAEAALGRLDESIVACREAAHLHRQLARGDPERWRAPLARSLDNLGVRLREGGRGKQGLVLSREAVDLFRRVARYRPDSSLGDLAGALTNLGTALGELGQRDDGIRALREAADTYSELSENRRDAFLPDLAASLTDLGLHFVGLEDVQAGVIHCQKAADIYRELALGRPEAFQPDLATALQNLSGALRRAGQFDKALVVCLEATSIRRSLADRDPGAFLPDLAGSLVGHCVLLGELRRHEEACAVGYEAVRIYRKLSDERPALFRMALAKSLEQLSKRLEMAGRDEDHWRALMEAMSVRCKLARNRWGLPRLSRIVLILISQLLIRWLIDRSQRRGRRTVDAVAAGTQETGPPPTAEVVDRRELPVKAIPFDRLTIKAQEVLRIAEEEAKGNASTYIGSEHIMLALLKHSDSSGGRLLAESSVYYDPVREMLIKILGKNKKEIVEVKQLIPTSRVRQVIELAFREADRMGSRHVGTEHLLLGLVIEGNGVAALTLHDYGISPETLIPRLSQCSEDGQSI